ncbi:MAG: 50S ribosomal protein L21 [Candidatus Nomurabacteria bacterium]|nr:MAG: 50S ribosomal protein L21 [Candidatus Nomurabacteria bacterium]
MKKAVIATGGKQYIVTEGETLEVERIKNEKANISFTPLLIIDGDKTIIGQPEVDGAKVTAKIVEETKADKVTSIRYKAKKRVKKVRGHRQILTKLLIDKITAK